MYIFTRLVTHIQGWLKTHVGQPRATRPPGRCKRVPMTVNDLTYSDTIGVQYIKRTVRRFDCAPNHNPPPGTPRRRGLHRMLPSAPSRREGRLDALGVARWCVWSSPARRNHRSTVGVSSISWLQASQDWHRGGQYYWQSTSKLTQGQHRSGLRPQCDQCTRTGLGFNSQLRREARGRSPGP